MDTDELRKCAKVVFLATNEAEAKDISIKLSTAASEIDMLRASLAVAKKHPSNYENCPIGECLYCHYDLPHTNHHIYRE